MAWSAPKTWNAGDVLSASDMNTYVRDNSLFLLSGRPVATVYQNSGADYTLTVATTWTTIDTTNLGLTLTTQSGRVRLEAIFTLNANLAAGNCGFDWLNNNTSARSQAGNIGTATWIQGGALNFEVPIKCIAWFTGLTPGTSYTFYLQYFKASGTVTMMRNGRSTYCAATEY